MKSKLTQIFIHLPLYYNPEKAHARRKRVERSKFDRTDQEIAYAFGGYSLFKNVEGLWIDERGTVHKDLHHVVFILALR